jgi:hypothetical protein
MWVGLLLISLMLILPLLLFLCWSKVPVSFFYIHLEQVCKYLCVIRLKLADKS